MRARRGRFVVALVAACALVSAGCLSRSYPEKHRYVLEVERDGAAGNARAPALRIEHVRVSPLFERKGFVYRTGESTYTPDFYHEFYVAPGVTLHRATVQWFQASPLFSRVAVGSDARDARWLLETRVNALYGDRRSGRAPRSVLEVEYTLLRARDMAVVLRKQYAAAVEVAAPSPDAFLEGWREATVRVLTELEADLATAIRR